MQEVAPGLWHWEASHPAWEASEPWAQDVSSCAIEDGEQLLLFDPLDLPNELEELVGERETAIVLTAPWHERDTQSLVERLGVPVYAPPPDTAEDLIRKYGITAEQAGDGSPDLVWLRAGGGEARWYAAGDKLPIGVEAFPGREHNDLVLWIESVGAVILGDTVVDFGSGLDMNEWLRESVTRESVVEGLRPLLALPVEFVLPAHGTPTDWAALERVLTAE